MHGVAEAYDLALVLPLRYVEREVVDHKREHSSYDVLRLLLDRHPQGSLRPVAVRLVHVVRQGLALVLELLQVEQGDP